MALNECQLPAKTDFYRALNRKMLRAFMLYQEMAALGEFLGRFTAADLTAMTVPTGEHSQYSTLKTAVEELVEFIESPDGVAVTPTKQLLAQINKFKTFV